MVSVPLRRDPEAGRRTVGIVLYVLGMVVGGLLLVLLMFFPALFSKNPDVELYSMFVGAMFALPMLLVYLWVPWIIDRYDPEPLWALLLVLAWGAIAGCGFAGLINSVVEAFASAAFGKDLGELVGACFSAPFVEEFMKGFGVFFIFYFWRREFDGVVDGVIYATFAALGFAAVENILYYGQAAKEAITTSAGEDAFYGTFIVRGILAPWGHPLYTSMTGLGFGISRETNKTWLKWLAPLGGYLFAAFLHFTWNFAASVSGLLVAIMLPLWFLFVIGFAVLVIYLVKRKGKIIRDHLRDEVLMGNLTPWELELVTSMFASLKATFRYGGKAGREFVHAAARLALSKWHTGRATQGRKLTISADMILPLRQELFRLRGEVARALGRPVQQPAPWNPGAQQPYPQQNPATQYAQPNPGAWRR
ncbi:MAG TPA: PrsW family intramembrane metalloprotease [Labilithrix sp.]|jgi:RsiW-degrading membrane proteinase PrsW (M82 family)